jgi:hypothetical protein
MFVNVVQAGAAGTSGFDYLLYPEQNPMTVNYLQNQLSTFGNSVTDIGRQFLEQSRVVYDRINDSSTIRAAKAALRSAKALFHPNTIIPLETLDEMRNAQPIMQRFMMAEPTIREIYHRQLCDGFYPTYQDMEPTKIGENHYDFRRVMDGIVVDTDEGWKATNYYEEILTDDKELTFQEKSYIISTWDMMKMFIEAGEDMTNPEGGELGI